MINLHTQILPAIIRLDGQLQNTNFSTERTRETKLKTKAKKKKKKKKKKD